MASSDDVNVCSICNKDGARRFCVGCKTYFCSKHFKEHEQDLSARFDEEVVQLHDEISEKIHELHRSNPLSSEFFNRIELWKRTAIGSVERAADEMTHQLPELVNNETTVLVRQLEPITNEIRSRRYDDNFAENDLERLKKALHTIQRSIEELTSTDRNRIYLVDNVKINWNQFVTIQKAQNFIVDIPENARWSNNGRTIAGGNGVGDAIDGLCRPYGVFVSHDDRTIVIADSWNHRIVQSTIGTEGEQTIAGGNGRGDRLNQLYCPTCAIVDKETDSLIISDWQNRRVVRWSRQCGTTQGEILINNISCRGLAMDNQRRLYVSDTEKQEIRRFPIDGDMNNGDVIAGGNGCGSGLNQFNSPLHIFVDQENAVYVSDHANHRVMKWNHGATEGIVVASGQGRDEALTQLSYPEGIFVDNSGTLYVAESRNNRVTRWPQGTTCATVVIGKDARLNWPVGLTFDRRGNIYVSEANHAGPHRIQRFSIQQT